LARDTGTFPEPTRGDADRLGEVPDQSGKRPAAIRFRVRAFVDSFRAQEKEKVRLAELLHQSGEPDQKVRARQLVEDVLREETLTPAFQRKQEAEWTHRARKIQNSLINNQGDLSPGQII